MFTLYILFLFPVERGYKVTLQMADSSSTANYFLKTISLIYTLRL